MSKLYKINTTSLVNFLKPTSETGKLKMEDLKDLVIQTLDTNGILDKFRAQLRSNVFSAIESTENKGPLAV